MALAGAHQPRVRQATVVGSALCGYAAALIGANVLTAQWGMMPVGFGQTATAGTLLVL